MSKSFIYLRRYGVSFIIIASMLVLITILSVILWIFSHKPSYTQFFQHLLIANQINYVLMAILSISIICLLLYIYRNYQKKQMGTALMAKLSIVLIGASIVPILLLYSVSVQFLQTSMNRWMQSNLIQSGLHVGDSFAKHLLQDKLNTQIIQKLWLGKTLPEEKIALIARLAELNQQFKDKSFSLFDAQGNLVYGDSYWFHDDVLQHLLQNTEYSAVEFDPNHQLYRIRIAFVHPKNASFFIQTVQGIPKEMSQKIGLLQQAHQQYQYNQTMWPLFNRFYHTTLTASLLLAIVLIILLALWISRQITQPLLFLEKNTKAAVDGEILSEHKQSTFHELSMLAQAFNHMIVRLNDARFNLQKGKDQLEAIISTMNSGLLLFDEQKRLTKYNQTANDILDINLYDYLHADVSYYRHTLFSLWQTVEPYFQHKTKWELKYEYTAPISKVHKTLLFRGNQLMYQGGKRYLIIFDDITEIMEAQKAQAWSQVAQRLAHEIKNPLTPIQLSAERLQIKLEGKLEPKLQTMVEKSTTTIINQVSSLKHLVDEFRNYARLPTSTMQAFNLNALIEEIAQMYMNDEHIKWQLNLPEIPSAYADIEQIRQVLHNILKNAKEAMQGHSNQKICIYTTVENNMIHLGVNDTGTGFSASIIEKVFDPYITTKANGTGLGMAIVKKMIDENQGKISIKNRNDGILGAQVDIWLRLVEEKRGL